jgi:hypothetical protein
MHNINNVAQLVHILEWQKTDHKPPESWGTNLHKGGKKIVTGKSHRKQYRPITYEVWLYYDLNRHEGGTYIICFAAVL